MKTACIKSFELGKMDNFVHFIYDTVSKRAAVVDPAWDVSVIIDFAKAEGLELTDILLTHSHYDHINGLAMIRDAYPDAKIHLSVEEAAFWGNVPKTALLHQDNDMIQLGETAIKVLFTPGHTPGSVCYYFDDKLVTGDSLFIYGCGRCDLPGGDAAQLFYSLKDLVARVAPETSVYSGHDYGVEKVTTLAAQVAGNPFLHCADSAAFVHYRMVEHDQTRHSPYTPVSCPH